MTRLKFLLSLSFVVSTISAFSQSNYSEKMASTAMTLWGTGIPNKWNYEQGLIMKSVEKVWEQTNNPVYLDYIKNKVDFFVTNTGTINTYTLSEYNIDHVNSGRSLIFLYNQYGSTKYKTAATNLRNQLASHPRTSKGGFWHKKVYPSQMWLDGLYMGSPFYAEYGNAFNEPSAFEDVANQFILMEKYARDTATGLLYHGWDESKVMAWANPTTGCSPSFWGRALGWYAMGLVDVLEIIPASHTKRDSLLQILDRLSIAITKYQDPTTGLWYQVTDKGATVGNYLEASSSSMFVYALAKAVRKGYLTADYLPVAQKGYDGIISNFITTDTKGVTHLNGICPAAGLGGNPYRDGTYAYYISVKPVMDDTKGVGAFILASVEIEKALITGNEYLTIEKSEFSTFPNPVHDVLNIKSKNEHFSYTIFNSLNQEVLRE